MVNELREGLRAAHDAQPRIILAQLATLLEPQPALAQHVLWLLQTGAITLEERAAPEEEAEDQLRQSCNKWRLCSVALNRRILIECCPALSEIWAQLKPAVLSQCVAIALHVDPGSALYSKHIPTLLARCRARYEEQGRRLDDMQDAFSNVRGSLTPNTRFGRFSLGEVDDEKTLTCIDGTTMVLPADLQSHVWTLERNEVFRSAQIRCGMLAILCAELFSNSPTRIQPPEYVATTPRSGQTGAAASSSGSPASIASSPGVAPPAGSGGAAP